MYWVIGFNVVLIVLAFVVGRGLFPIKVISGLVEGFHATIGITPPTEKQLRWVVVVWIASVLVIVDMMLILFAYVF